MCSVCVHYVNATLLCPKCMNVIKRKDKNACKKYALNMLFSPGKMSVFDNRKKRLNALKS